MRLDDHEMKRGSRHEGDDEEHGSKLPARHLTENDASEPGEESGEAGEFEGPHLVLVSVDGEMLV